MSCDQELCANWTGDGCACAVFGIDPKCGACEAGVHQHCDRLRRASSCCCDDGDEA